MLRAKAIRNYEDLSAHSFFGKGGQHRSGCSRRSTVISDPTLNLGDRVFFNFNCIVLDVCRVTIGNYTMFGPAVQILTPMHPLNAELRRKQEYGKPIPEIGSDVWVGGGALILPGVRIRLTVGYRCGQRGHSARFLHQRFSQLVIRVASYEQFADNAKTLGL